MNKAIEKFQNYLQTSIEQSNSLQKWIEQKEFHCELEQFDSEFTQLCEVFELDAKDPTLFVFSASKYIEELEEHRFKTLLSSSSRTLKIMQAVQMAKKTSKSDKVSIAQIIKELDTKSIQESHKYISHILSLSYYFKWNIEQKEGEIDTLACLEIPDTFLLKIKERFNLDNMLSLYENENICMYLNGKNRLIAYFKTKDEFSKKDIETYIFPALKTTLQFEEIVLKK